jgi:Flp pilus assembly protein TadG
VRSKIKTLLRCECGTQLLEFAFLLPFLIFVFAGIVEMGRMFYTYTTLNKATEVGARYLSTRQVTAGNYSSADLVTAKNLTVCGQDPCSGQTLANNLTTSNVSVTPPGTGTGTRYVSVSISYDYQPLIWNLGHLGGGSLSLNYTFTPKITMRYME